MPFKQFTFLVGSPELRVHRVPQQNSTVISEGNASSVGKIFSLFFLSIQIHCKKAWTVSTRRAIDFSDLGLSDMLLIQLHTILPNQLSTLTPSSQSLSLIKVTSLNSFWGEGRGSPPTPRNFFYLEDLKKGYITSNNLISRPC